MPGVFSRGRWKCWDYKDSSDTPAFNPEERDILEFDARTDRADILTANGASACMNSNASKNAKYCEYFLFDSCSAECVLLFDSNAWIIVAAAAQEEPIFLTPPRETYEPQGSSTIMVTSMALHESSPHASNVTTAVSSLSAVQPVVLTSASIPPNISVISSDVHRPGTIPPMQSPSLPSTVHNAISSLSGHSHSTINMFDATRCVGLGVSTGLACG
jgi:hypothetical protein